MIPRPQNKLVQYVVAVAATSIVLAVRLLLEDFKVLDSAPYVLFAVSIAGAAWMGGWGPGLVATVLSWLAVDFLIITPRYQFHFTDYHEAVPQAVFLVQGIIISWLGATRLRAMEAARVLAEELEHRVEDRTAQLKEAYSQLQRESAERLKALEELEHESGERQRAYAKLEDANRRLDVSNRELQDFASVASHDLQEPLRKIVAFGERLKTKAGEGLGPEPRDYLARMQNAAGRMQTLINDLLTFSRVTSKARPFEPTDLRQIAADVVGDLEARIEQQGAKVDLAELPTVDADPLQMRQLFQNLIGNALKFNADGRPPEVKVWAELRPEGQAFGVPMGMGDRVTVFVKDNGIGFDEKYLDRIFTVFQRLHGRGTYEGTGIGLAVCRKIVERHGGTITAQSRPGEGATFVVDLPVRQTRTEAGAGVAAPGTPTMKEEVEHAGQATEPVGR